MARSLKTTSSGRTKALLRAATVTRFSNFMIDKCESSGCEAGKKVEREKTESTRLELLGYRTRIRARQFANR